MTGTDPQPVSVSVQYELVRPAPVPRDERLAALRLFGEQVFDERALTLQITAPALCI